jgi:hypothetical protein
MRTPLDGTTPLDCSGRGRCVVRDWRCPRRQQQGAASLVVPPSSIVAAAPSCCGSAWREAVQGSRCRGNRSHSACAAAAKMQSRPRITGDGTANAPVETTATARHARVRDRKQAAGMPRSTRRCITARGAKCHARYAGRCSSAQVRAAPAGIPPSAPIPGFSIVTRTAEDATASRTDSGQVSRPTGALAGRSRCAVCARRRW